MGDGERWGRLSQEGTKCCVDKIVTRSAFAKSPNAQSATLVLYVPRSTRSLHAIYKAKKSYDLLLLTYQVWYIWGRSCVQQWVWSRWRPAHYQLYLLLKTYGGFGADRALRYSRSCCGRYTVALKPIACCSTAGGQNVVDEQARKLCKTRQDGHRARAPAHHG